MSEDMKPGQETPIPEEKDTLTPEEANQDIKFEDEELNGIDEDTSKKIKTSDAQKKHWREKHKRDAIDPETGKTYKELLEETKKAPEKPEEKKTPEKIKGDDSDWKAKVDIKISNKDLDDTDVDEALAIAKSKGITPAEAIDSDLFKAHLHLKAEKKKKEDAVVSPSSRVGQGISDMAEFHEKAQTTQGMIEALSTEEFEKYDKWIQENRK